MIRTAQIGQVKVRRLGPGGGARERACAGIHTGCASHDGWDPQAKSCQGEKTGTQA